MGKAFIGLVVPVACLVGCKKVVKNPADPSVPSVVIKVKGADGQYAPATQATMSAASAGALELMCIVEDPQGVKSITVNFDGQSDGCNVEGAVYNGNFDVTPVPDNLHQSLTGDANDQVITKLPMLATITGPFKCQPLGGDQGIPYGGTITVKCTGANWSSNPANDTADTTLTIKLQ